MQFGSKNKFVVAIEKREGDGWVTYHPELDVYLKSKPVFDDHLAAAGFYILVEDWSRHTDDSPKYRLALYKVKRSGVRKLVKTELMDTRVWKASSEAYTGLPWIKLGKGNNWMFTKDCIHTGPCPPPPPHPHTITKLR